MGDPGSGWIDCGRWGGANFWRWTPQAGEIPQEVVTLLKRVERPSMEFDTGLALQLIRDECASLYVANDIEQPRLVGALMVNVSQSTRIGKVLEIEGSGFKPREAQHRWNFVQALARENECVMIRAISSRRLHKVFPDLQPHEIIFYAKVK